MVISSMSDMLKRLGWADGFHVPIANAENRALEEQLMKLTMRRVKASASHELANSQLEALEKHLKFLHQESGQNQILLNEYKRQIDSESQQILLNKAQKDRVNHDTRQLAKTIADIKDRTALKKTDLTRAYARMEKIKSEASWDKEALSGWEEAIQKRDDDNDLLKKFTLQDAKRIEELDVKRQAVSLEVVHNKKLIDKMVADCLNNEQVLQRTRKMSKKQGIEREALVKRWQDSIRVLRQRDLEMRALETYIETAGDSLLRQRDLVEEETGFLENQRLNNEVIQEEIVQLNQTSSRIRSELCQLIEYSSQLQNDYAAVQRLVKSTAQELEKQRIKGKHLDSDAENKKLVIQALHLEVNELKTKMDEIKNASLSVAERLNRLERILDHEKHVDSNLDLDITRITDILYRTRQKLRDLEGIFLATNTEVHCCETSIKLLQRRVHIERAVKEKEENEVYDLEYRIDRLSSRLDQAEGAVKDIEASDIAMTRILELEGKLHKEKESRSLLQNQVIRLSEDMRRLTMEITKDSTIYNRMQEKLIDNKLLYEGGLKLVLAVKQRTQQRHVDENMFRLRVSQINNFITIADDNIFNLRQLKVDLEMAMQARKIEVETHRDTIIAQRNTINEEIGRLRMDIRCREIRLEQFNNKHHLAVMSLGQNEDGEPLSITYFKIRYSQEKHELEHKGTELHIKITTTEQEITAMENTIKVMYMTNQKFKHSLTLIEDKDAKQINDVQKKLDAAIIQTSRENKRHTKHQDQLYDLQHQYKYLTNRRDELKQLLIDHKQEEETYKREYKVRIEKIHKANIEIKALKNKIPQKKRLKYNKDLHIRYLQDANIAALKQLADIAGQQRNLTPIVTQQLEARGLTLPRPRLHLAHSDVSMTSDSMLPSDSSISDSVVSVGGTSTNSSSSRSSGMTKMFNIRSSTSQSSAANILELKLAEHESELQKPVNTMRKSSLVHKKDSSTPNNFGLKKHAHINLK